MQFYSFFCFICFSSGHQGLNFGPRCSRVLNYLQSGPQINSGPSNCLTPGPARPGNLGPRWSRPRFEISLLTGLRSLSCAREPGMNSCCGRGGPGRGARCRSRGGAAAAVVVAAAAAAGGAGGD